MALNIQRADVVIDEKVSGAIALLHHPSEIEKLPLVVLSQDERERLENFGNANRQLSFATGRCGLREIIGDLSGQPATDVTLETRNSKPYLTGPLADWSISISHVEHMSVVAVLKDRPMGLDVESSGPRTDAHRIREYLGWPDRFIIRDEGMFRRLWTLWEATAKCQSGGVFRRDNKVFHHLVQYLESDFLRSGDLSAQPWHASTSCLSESRSLSIVFRDERCAHWRVEWDDLFEAPAKFELS